MSYKFADHLLIRMPVKSWKSYGEANLQLLLNDPFFQSAIYIASPGFYNRLERVKFNYLQLNERERYTLKKYYNRICFRPTPFGLFSSVTPIGWGAQTTLKPGNNDGYTPCVNPDQSYLMAIAQEMINNGLHDTGFFTPNPTIYRSGKEYRFIITDIDEKLKTRQYHLQSTDYSVLLKSVLAFCDCGKSMFDIIDYITTNTGCTDDEGEEYFRFMADSQLLLSNLRPNITGSGYLDRLLNHLQTTNIDDEKIARLTDVQQAMRTHRAIQPEWFISLNKKLLKSLHSPHPDADQPQQLSVVLTKNNTSGTLGYNYQQDIADAIFALDCLLPQENLKSLAQFVKLFKHQFDQQSVLLLKVLDPEIGIAYNTIETGPKSPLLETINVYKTGSDDKITWSPVHRYLLDRWHDPAMTGLPVIRLNKEDLVKLKSADYDIQTMGMSVLFKIVNKKVIIENAGGVNAPALAGRFTVANPDIFTAARKMAAEVEAANPDIIFAELVHLSDPHVDNINRRERIWTKEIPITASSLADRDDQIKLSDIYVSVENDKVVLRSARHNKIVIPRLTSAYNHALNKLPLFCFLADVPYQYFKSQYTLNLSRLFPGLAFYPRVEYLNTILHLATWVLSKDEIQCLAGDDEAKVLPAFKQMADRILLPAMFSLVQGDQQLVFYRDIPNDVLLFAECVKNKDEATIKECLPDDADSLIKDECGNSYVNQFNAFLYTDTPLRFLPKPIMAPHTTRVQRHFVLGSEWLYLKFYVPKVAINGLLLTIRPLLKHPYTHSAVKKWFFIRYEDNAPHVRLRLKIAPEDLSEILIAFKEKLHKSIGQNIIREYQTDIYSREVERYQAGDYDLTEDFFWRSSELVMQYLRAQKLWPDATSEYLFALTTVNEVLTVFLPDYSKQMAFVQMSYQQFMAEFDDQKLNVQLDKKYRELSKSIYQIMSDPHYYSALNLKAATIKFINAAKLLSKSATHKPVIYQYFLSSIIHMHLNRIFIDDSRKQEMITYYLLYKYQVSQVARKKTAMV